MATTKLSAKLALERRTLLLRAEAREAEAATLPVNSPGLCYLRHYAANLRSVIREMDLFVAKCERDGYDPEVG